MNLDMGVYLRIALFYGQSFGLNVKNLTLGLPTVTAHYHCRPFP